MKKSILLLGIFFFSINMFAQKLEMSMGINMGSGYIDYYWNDDFKNNQSDYGVELIGPNAYFYLTGKISKHFFLKTTISANDYNTFVDIEYSIYGYYYHILKHITVNQYILSISPEYRYIINKSISLFVNAGISLNKIQSSTDMSLTHNAFRSGILANAGVNLKINNNFGVTMGLGFNKEYDTESISYGQIPNIAMHKYYLQMGFLYSID